MVLQKFVMDFGLEKTAIFCYTFAARISKRIQTLNNTMKKTMIFAALMCCFVSMSAQQLKHEPKHQQTLKEKVAQVEKLNRYTNTFTETLDSIYSDFEKCQFEYDNRFNCVKIDYYWFDDEWVFDYTEKLTYDELDRVVMWVESSDDYAMKLEFNYNENGWLSEEFEYELMEDGNWEPIGKYTYEYDADGHMVLSVGYELQEEWLPTARMTWEYEGGRLINDIYYYHGETDWMPLTRNDYSYNAEGLCQQQLQSNWEGEWIECYKVEYEYDEVGNRIMETSSTCYDLDEWIYTYRKQYSYDVHNNLIASGEYYYNETDWELESSMTYIYDLTVPVESTAGIMMVWDEEMPIHDKLLSWQLRAYGDEWTTTLFYSNCVGLNENPESLLQLWPNPASETIHIDGLNAAEVQVYNAHGQLVKTVQGSNEINVSSLPQGMYFVTVGNSTQKIVVNR